MRLELFLKGLLVGFAIAAPVGPVGILCIRRSISGGTRMGLAVGLGAALADSAYGAVAALGLVTLSRFLWEKQFYVGLFGGVILCVLGVRTFFAKPLPQTSDSGGKGWFAAFGSAFLLTLANPATVLSFLAVFTSMGIAGEAEPIPAALLIVGVFSGSCSWWLMLSGGAGALRSKVREGGMAFINRVSGTALTAFGLYAFFRCLLALI